MTGVICQRVSAGYGSKEVLHDVDIEVAPGEWVALVGPNGSGKSTLLRCIAGSIDFRGELTIGGHPVDRMSRRERSRLVALVPQQPLIPEDISVLEYVLLGRTPYISYWGSESVADMAAARRVMSRLDLTDHAAETMTSLSGGERQRGVLGRALAQDAGVLLLDEPTTALDLGHQVQVMQLVDELRRERKIAVLSAVHDLTLAAQYADRLVLLDGGSVVAEGAADVVLTPELLSKHYQAEVSILRDDAGDVVVAPRKPQLATNALNSDPTT